MKADRRFLYFVSTLAFVTIVASVASAQNTTAPTGVTVGTQAFKPQVPKDLLDRRPLQLDRTVCYKNTSVDRMVSTILKNGFSNQTDQGVQKGGPWAKSMEDSESGFKPDPTKKTLGCRSIVAFTPNVDFAIAPVFDINQCLTSCSPPVGNTGASATIVARFNRTTQMEAAKNVIRGILKSGETDANGARIPLSVRGPQIVASIENEKIKDKDAIHLAQLLRKDYDTRKALGQSDQSIENDFINHLAALRVKAGPTGDQVWNITQVGDQTCLHETQGIAPPKSQVKDWKPMNSGIIPASTFAERHEELLGSLLTGHGPGELPQALTATNDAIAGGKFDPKQGFGSCALATGTGSGETGRSNENGNAGNAGGEPPAQ